MGFILNENIVMKKVRIAWEHIKSTTRIGPEWHTRGDPCLGPGYVNGSKLLFVSKNI